ncbi:MAG: hypothetical protein JWM19_865 [Actinomycetia bacterium]|nr:hypothetical protein [Actinomycetes bacterium]
MRLRNGTCRELEDQANELIRESLVGVTSRAAKSDILTEWKQQDRWDHEIYVASGTADPAVRRGQFSRTWNGKYPHLNSRDGHYPVRRAQDGLDTYTGDEGGSGSDE